MCMIAHRFLSQKGKGSNIPNDVIDLAMQRHSDGFGVAWRDPKHGLVYEKYGPNTDHALMFRMRLKEIDSDPTIEYVAHFRFATHGPEDSAHAHPYQYEDPDPEVGTVLVFHNGIISGVKTTTLESDTEVFVRDYLAKLPSRWWDNPGIRRLVDHMGGWSKLVLMTADETVNLNYSQGEDDGGLWYSSDHRPYKYVAATGTSYKTTYRSEDDDYADWLKDNSGAAEDSEFGLMGAAYRPRPTAGAIGAPSTTPMGNDALWLDERHTLTPTQKFDFLKDGDYPASITCDECDTEGDVYLIGGKAYVDIKHLWDEEDENDLLPDEGEVDLPSTGIKEVRMIDSVEAVAVTSAGETALIAIPAGASGTDYAGVRPVADPNPLGRRSLVN